MPLNNRLINMTQENIELLFQDICARLPYGIVVQQSAQYQENHFMYSIAEKWKTESHDFKIIGIQGMNTLITDKLKEEKTYAKGIVSSPITICIYDNFTKQIAKPYLRPLSSMTEEEIKEHAKQICEDDEYLHKTFESPYNCTVGLHELNWLNKHHFDYNHLIERGLALEAPKYMYLYMEEI